MIFVVTTNGIFVIDTSLYHAPIILMLDGKVITQTVSRYLTALLKSHKRTTIKLQTNHYLAFLFLQGHNSEEVDYATRFASLVSR